MRRPAFRPMAMRFAVLILFFTASQAGAQCVAQSGPGTVALVELYTSEGCSSCPPADRWLASLHQRHASASLVPLALHVDYWDYIGWKDPYGKREFSLRQRKLSQLQRLALVYTPQVLLQGRDFRGWGTRALEVQASAELLESADDPGLYLAVYESKLQSRVSAGENRGRILNHDYVVLEWQGRVGRGPGRQPTDSPART